MKRILVVEDHDLFRQSLTNLLDREPDFEVVGQARSISEGRDLCASETFDVVILDLHLPDGDGKYLIGDIREANPHAYVLVLTTFPGEAEGSESDGMLGKDAVLVEISSTIRRFEND
jgi:DNA-binding NarL/FixJ family response regulator